MAINRDLAGAAKAWPFEEARKLLARFNGGPTDQNPTARPPDKGYVLFETGYGPSGLPHIGTFGEVARTTMVRQAFQCLSDLPTRLFAFSDDMDGLRKVPENIPNRAMVSEFLGRPLTKIPDPFGEYESFGHHNNARLRGFLDGFGFDYEFQSSTAWYQSGRFDSALLAVLRAYEEIMAVMLPTLGTERAGSYSPFLPVSPSSGKVLQVPILETRPEAGTIIFMDEDGRKVELPVTGGHCKLQWKPDWGMRWFALGVDYEMYGKDLIPSAQLASRICRILGREPPAGFNYELFLDDQGRKISKSLGNGLAIEDWLKYAPGESLALYMFQKPRAAKRLYFDVIPRAVDEYLGLAAAFERESPAKRLENPAWHIHYGAVPPIRAEVSFNLLLNLASVANAESREALWGYITRYVPTATPESAPFLDRLVEHALRYYQDFVRPAKRYRTPSEAERLALNDLVAALEALPANADADAAQTVVYEVGKRHPFPDLKSWFQALYEILLGQPTGPRMGSFIVLYGLADSCAMIRSALAGTLAQAPGDASRDDKLVN